MGARQSDCCSCDQASDGDLAQAKSNIVQPRNYPAASPRAKSSILQEEAKEKARIQARARSAAQHRQRGGGDARDATWEAGGEPRDGGSGAPGQPSPADRGQHDKAKSLIAEELACGSLDGALLVACYCGDLQAAEECFHRGALPTHDMCGRGIGYFSTASGSLPLVKLVLSKDVHKEYSREWFYLRVGVDDATPLMAALWAGHEGVYTHLLYDLGCPLLLRGSRFPDEYMSKSLQHWLGYLPEISNVEMIPRRQPVQLRHNIYDQDGVSEEFALNRKIGDEDLEAARKRRMQTRNFIRACLNSDTGLAPRASPGTGISGFSVFHVQQPPLPLGRNPRKALVTAALAGVSDNWEPPLLNGMHNTPTGQLPGKPALPGWLESEKAKLEPDPKESGPQSGPSALGFEVMASIVPVGASILLATLGRRGGAGRASTTMTGGASSRVNMWACGACQHLHRMDMDASGVQTLECDECHKRNLVPEDRGVETSASDSGETDVEEGGDWWDNEAYEFSSEKVVRECMPMIQRSVLWSMGMHKMRELLRVVKIEQLPRGQEIFRHEQPVEKLYFLKSGSVALWRAGEEVGSVSLSEGELSNAQFLDLIAVNRGGGHTVTATVSSPTASLATFSEKDICDHCGYNSLHELIGNAIPLAMIRELKLFRACITKAEQMALAKAFEYVEYFARDVLVMQGPVSKKLVIVQAGTVRLSGGIGKFKDGAEKVVRVGGERPKKVELKKDGESWEPAKIFCGRSVVFRCQQPVQVQATSEVVEAWVLNPERCDPELSKVNCHMQLQRIITVCLYTQWISRLPIFSRLKVGDMRLRYLAEALLPKEYWEEEDIVAQAAEDGGDLFILVEGTALVIRDGEKVNRLTADADSGKVFHFGEEDIVKARPRDSTVRVKSTKAWVLQVSPQDIEKEFGSMDELLSEQGMTTDSYLQDLMRGHGDRKKERGRNRAIQKRMRSIIDVDMDESLAHRGEEQRPNTTTKAKAKPKSKGGDKSPWGVASPRTKGKARTEGKVGIDWSPLITEASVKSAGVNTKGKHQRRLPWM